MHFVVEERKAWVRTQTHTLIFDRDPDFERFSRDRSGTVKKLYRIWLASTPSAQRTYLGSVHRCADRWSFRDLTRLFRRASAYASGAGVPSRGLRLQLAAFLRELSLRGLSSPREASAE